MTSHLGLYIGGTVQSRTAKVGPAWIFKCTPVGREERVGQTPSKLGFRQNSDKAQT